MCTRLQYQGFFPIELARESPPPPPPLKIIYPAKKFSNNFPFLPPDLTICIFTGQNLVGGKPPTTLNYNNRFYNAFSLPKRVGGQHLQNTIFFVQYTLNKPFDCVFFFCFFGLCCTTSQMFQYILSGWEQIWLPRLCIYPPRSLPHNSE